jgi:hypothetical protein
LFKRRGSLEAQNAALTIGNNAHTAKCLRFFFERSVLHGFFYVVLLQKNFNKVWFRNKLHVLPASQALRAPVLAKSCSRNLTEV